MENDRIKFAQDVVLNQVRDKGKRWCKLSYKSLKEEYGYDTLLDISTYLTLIQLKYSLGGNHHFVTVVGKWIFDINFTFSIPLTKENLEYFFFKSNSLFLF